MSECDAPQSVALQSLADHRSDSPTGQRAHSRRACRSRDQTTSSQSQDAGYRGNSLNKLQVLRSSYTKRTKCAISDAFVRDCVFAYCASVAQYVYSPSAEHCFRLRNTAISDERVRDCALSTESVFRPLAFKQVPGRTQTVDGARRCCGSPRNKPRIATPRVISGSSKRHFTSKNTLWLASFKTNRWSTHTGNTLPSPETAEMPLIYQLVTAPLSTEMNL